MSRSMLPNKSYRDIEKEQGVRGEYVLGRVYPWVARTLFIGGVALMTYGGINMDKNIDRGQRAFGVGALTSFVSGYVLDMRRKTNQLTNRLQKDSEEDKMIMGGIVNNHYSLENNLND